MSTHEKLIVALEWRINNHTSFFSDDDLTAMQRAAAALRELLNEREEYQQAVTALDESMKHVPVNEQLIKLNIELGTAKLEIRELRAKLEKAEEENSRLRKAIEDAPCDCISNWTLDTIGNHKADCWKRNALEGEE